jgi:ABC-type glutathione transport system ATPase component
MIRWSIVRGVSLNLLLSVLVCFLSFGSIRPFSADLTWATSSVSLEDVSQSYSSSAWRRLTSSVPRREFAVEKLSLSIESEFLMLVGASSTGKSTVLRLILGEEPVSGKVRIATSDPGVSPALPVLLDERPPFDNQRVVRSILTDAIQQTAPNAPLLDLLLDDMTNVFELDLEKKPSQLSSSESFRCRLAEASLQSMLHHHGVSTSSSKQLPAPILLLDEWMDTETSTVIRKVQTSLERLVDRGAVIVCVTHKPHLYNTDNVRIVTLCRGAMLPKLL